MKQKKSISIKYLALLLLTVCQSIAGQERVCLHTDAMSYSLGDTLWYAAYVGDMATKRLSEKSRVLHVELLSPEGMVLQHDRLPIEGGRSHGCMPLPQELQSGLFELRAYTLYMMEEGRDKYFSLVFPLYGHTEKDGRTYSVLRHRERKEGKLLSSSQVAQEDSLKGHLRMVCTPAVLSPFTPVTLTIYGRPNEHFSLSVKDADTSCRQHTDTDTDRLMSIPAISPVAPDNVQDTWLVEKGITIRGKAQVPSSKLLKLGRLQGLPDTPLAVVTDSAGVLRHGSTTTDGEGFFLIDYGDFYGRGQSVLLTGNRKAEFSLDRGNMPVTRLYTAKEKELEHTADSVVKRGERMRGWREYVSSCVHINIDEVTEGITTGDARTLALECMARLGYPGLSTRMICLRNDYPADGSVPETDLVYDGQFIDLSKYKEMVIRTDPAICSRYNFTRVPHTLDDAYDMTSSTGTRFQSIGYGPAAESKHARGINGSNLTGTPSIIVCFVPKTAAELAKEQSSRLPKGAFRTVVRGYAQPATFSSPDYSSGHPNSDHRRTLYWNPDVTTDSQGQATITFYNNSSCRQFSISAEGITADGRAIIYEQ